MRHEIRLDIVGLGVIFYSPFAVAEIEEGDDYFSASFENPEDVASHVMRGNIAAFCTGSSGDFQLVIYDGELDARALGAAEFRIRLGLEVRDGTVCFRDCYDLKEWTKACPASQQIRLADGFYRNTVYSSAPASGIIGDDQTIYLHFEEVPRMPPLNWRGVPNLC